MLTTAAGSYGVDCTVRGQRVKYDAPPVLPVKLEIVYHEEQMMRGANCVNYSGTVTFTFRNEACFPITLAFPPIRHYTYSCSRRVQSVWPMYRNKSQTIWQEQPFPDEKRLLPEFARKQRDVVIPAGESVVFTEPFNIGCTEGNPSMNHVFVFGMPRSPSSHPVLGTIYARSVESTGTPKDYSDPESPLDEAPPFQGRASRPVLLIPKSTCRPISAAPFTPRFSLPARPWIEKRHRYFP